MRLLYQRHGDDGEGAAAAEPAPQRRPGEGRPRREPLSLRHAHAHSCCGTPRRRGDDFVGNVVNLAARIVDLAGAGEVLASAALLDAAGDLSAVDAKAHELGPVYVKGVPEPVALFRLEPEVSGAHR